MSIGFYARLQVLWQRLEANKATGSAGFRGSEQGITDIYKADLSVRRPGDTLFYSPGPGAYFEVNTRHQDEVVEITVRFTSHLNPRDASIVEQFLRIHA